MPADLVISLVGCQDNIVSKWFICRWQRKNRRRSVDCFRV